MYFCRNNTSRNNLTLAIRFFHFVRAPRVKIPYLRVFFSFYDPFALFFPPPPHSLFQFSQLIRSPPLYTYLRANVPSRNAIYVRTYLLLPPRILSFSKLAEYLQNTRIKNISCARHRIRKLILFAGIVCTFANPNRLSVRSLRLWERKKKKPNSYLLARPQSQSANART